MGLKVARQLGYPKGPLLILSIVQLGKQPEVPFLGIALDHSSARDAPLFVQLAVALSDAIRQGRLQAGDRLPGTRTLAASLGLNRNTVVAAFDELRAQGWLETSRGSGSFVSASMPRRRRAVVDSRPRVFAARPHYSFHRRRTRVPVDSHSHIGVDYNLGGGSPDARLAPIDGLARAYRRALRRHHRDALDYGDPRGAKPLRVALAEMLRHQRGLVVDSDDILVTRGSQQALALIALTLLRRQDRVAVAALSYDQAWSVFRLAGAKLCGIPTDCDGLIIDRVAKRLAEDPLRAVYLTPHHQYPTTAVLSAPRRLALLELARRNRFMIIEDDYDNEFHWSGRPLLPLAASDQAGVHGSNVIYVGTLSKVLAPGLRIGYVIAPRPVLDQLSALRVVIDRQGDHIVEIAIAELIEDGELGRHIRKVKKVYAQRRERLAFELRHRLDDWVSFSLPPGGLAFWVRLNRGLDACDIAERALAVGVACSPARSFALDGRPRPYLRLGFAAANEEEIVEGVRRLALVIKASVGKA